MSYEKVSSYWLKELGNYSEEQFAKKPAEGSWSVGQVYTHLIMANDHFFIKNAAQCLNGEGEHKKGGKSKWGRLLFAINGFPPIKFKKPGGAETEPRQPENIEYIRRKLQVSIETMTQLSPKLAGYDPMQKVKHPAFGYLNAKEWFQMNLMHFRHHLRQKKKLDKL